MSAPLVATSRVAPEQLWGEIAVRAFDVFDHLYPQYEYKCTGGILGVGFDKIQQVFLDTNLKAHLHSHFGLGTLRLSHITVECSNRAGADIGAGCQWRSPTIEELLACQSAGTALRFFVMQVVQHDENRRHCIALVTSPGGNHTFVDCARDAFYEATPESFTALGFAGIWDAREATWQPEEV